MWRNFQALIKWLVIVAVLIVFTIIGTTRLITMGKSLIVFNGYEHAVHIQWRWATLAPVSHIHETRILCQVFQQRAAESLPPYDPPPAPTIYQRHDRPTWIDDYTSFLGWSNQYRYVADRTFDEIRIWDTNTHRVIAEFERQIHDLWWSPGDQYVAIVILAERPAVRILELATGRMRTAPINNSPLRYNIYGEWAPDEQSFVIVYESQNGENFIEQYHFDGETKTLLSPYVHRTYYGKHRLGVWSESGEHLRYWETLGNEYQLIDHNLATNTKRVETTALRPPQQHNHLSAVYDVHPDDTHSIRLIDLHDLRETTFIARKDELGDPNLRSDLQWVAAAYDADSTDGRDMHLAWSRVDGSDYREYNNPAYVDIRHVEWSEEGDKLSFVGVYDNDTYDMQIVDLHTGEIERLIANAPDLISWIGGRRINIWGAYTYSDDSGDWYWMALNRRMELTYRVKTDVYINRVDEFPSPDGTMMALKLHGAYPKRYVAIGKSDQIEFETIRDDVGQFGSVLWSPDGQMVQFGREISGYNTESLIYNAEGEFVTYFQNSSGNWMSCS